MALNTGGSAGYVANAYVSVDVPGTSTSTLVSAGSNVAGMYVELVNVPGNMTLHTGANAPSAGNTAAVGRLSPIASVSAMHRLGVVLPAGQGLYGVNSSASNGVITVNYRLL